MVALGVTALLITTVAVASAAPPSTAPGKNPLICSENEPEDCTIVNKNSAVIDMSDAGSAAAVYYEGFNNSWYGVKTSLVKDLSNNVSGSPLGIDPRWSIPIDDRTNATAPAGFTDYFVFVAFGTCNNGAGLVDVINDPTCDIVTPTATYPNWSQFAQSNTSTYIALEDNYTFIIADGSGAPGVWTVSNVKVGKPGK
jgi:hypothetical protein